MVVKTFSKEGSSLPLYLLIQQDIIPQWSLDIWKFKVKTMIYKCSVSNLSIFSHADLKQRQSWTIRFRINWDQIKHPYSWNVMKKFMLLIIAITSSF